MKASRLLIALAFGGVLAVLATGFLAKLAFMPLIQIIIADAFLCLLVVYFGAGVIAAWRHRDWRFGRFLPLLAAGSLVLGALLPGPASYVVGCLDFALLAAVCAQTWRNRTGLDRSLHLMSTFWLLWLVLGVALTVLRF